MHEDRTRLITRKSDDVWTHNYAIMQTDLPIYLYTHTFNVYELVRQQQNITVQYNYKNQCETK